MHWEMEGYGSQCHIGESHNFWKNDFLIIGQVNTQKLLPIPLLIHVLHFLTQLEIAGSFPSCFSCISFISMVGKTCFCIVELMCNRDS